MDKEMQSKAIAYFSNGIGNFIMMSPALTALSVMIGSTIDICLDAKWNDGRRQPILDMCKVWDVIGKVVNYPEDKLDDYEHWFITPHNNYSEAVPIFMDRQTNPPLSKPNWKHSLVHEEDWYMESIYAMGYKGKKPPKLAPVDKYFDMDKEILQNSPIIGICNGAFNTDYWKKKKWCYFAELAVALKNYYSCSVIGIGAEGELDGIPLDKNYAGKLSITESSFVISQCDLFITTDTGCMHIADALDIPMVVLFGSTLTSKNAPKSKKARIMKAEMECVPCQGDGKFWSCEVNACMENITASDVMATVKEIMRGKNGKFN